MKKTKITLIIGWLFFLSASLFAQNTEGRFKLKEGDWFEIQVERDYIVTQDQPLNSPLQRQVNNETYLLNYQLKKQFPNGNQSYEIRVEHFKAIKKFGDYLVGYDSYYPPFEENKPIPETKNQFSLEVIPAGKIVQLTPSKNNKSTKVYTSIKSSYGSNNIFNYSDQVDDKWLVEVFSKALMQKDSLPKHTQLYAENGIPTLMLDSDSKLSVTDASFPLPNNAIIQGKLNDQNNHAIKISLKGENSDYYFPEKQFRTNSDGSFNCPIFLKRPLHLRVQVGSQTLSTFMEPGDTLNISAIGHQAREIQYNQYAETKPNEYYSPDREKSEYFSGNAAYNTMLSNELDQFRNGFVYEKEIGSVLINAQKTTVSVNQLLESYRGKASEECIKYFQIDFKYFLAAAKLYFDMNRQISYWENLHNNKIQHKSDENLLQKDYPADFFLEVDTMPILMNPYEWNSSYHSFISLSQQFKQNRLGWSVGKKYGENFLENYAFAQASLSGYPLYSQIARSIVLELRKGLADNNVVTPYYHDFMNNCADPVLTEPLKTVFETAEQLKIGNTFPIKSFVLQDSSIFNLEKFKGKPICLILFDGPKSSFNQFKENIEKFKPEEVEFLFVQATGTTWLGGEVDSTIWKKSNVTYFELTKDYLKSKLLLKRTKIFMLDKWFRIVENNAEDPMTHKYKGSISEFEKSLRKTIDAKRYSKAEKTAMIKTAGWSFGSILFTFLIGLWIYRIRIRRIKTQEAAKRRIKELEIKAIRSQMNPHFIFNALNSIQSLINGSQFKEANIYLSKFAVLLRGVLNNSEKSRISLSDELQAVELYCQLEQLRFEFKFEISIDPEVDCDLIEIPGMIIQPLAENAVVHGLSGKGALGKLDIQVKRQNGNLCVCVSDNGIGLQTQKIDELSQKGFGLKLVEERINILNLDGKEAKLTVENRSNATGTVATLIIPID